MPRASKTTSLQLLESELAANKREIEVFKSKSKALRRSVRHQMRRNRRSARKNLSFEAQNEQLRQAYSALCRLLIDEKSPDDSRIVDSTSTPVDTKQYEFLLPANTDGSRECIDCECVYINDAESAILVCAACGRNTTACTVDMADLK